MNDPDARQRCLDAINDVLAENRLRPWEARHLGDPAEGQCQITDFLDAKTLGPRRVAITVRIRDTQGQECDITVRFGGAVVYVVPLLNLVEGPDAPNGPMLCFTKRWRIEHGDWSLELPHGLVQEDDLGDPVDPLFSRSHRVLAGTFGQEAVESLAAAKILPLGTFKLKGEAAPAEAYILAATVLRNFTRRKGDGGIVKFAWNDIGKLLENGNNVLTEPATVATIFRAAKNFPPMKKGAEK
ncbi:MAG TPA: hypothetical protein VL500_00270 [Candidatus Eisenbacteria bacterium]|jgi:hypothetical protein|nr:hypothetical protein [Candidatus Eisenbacteria bacterium]